MEGSGRVGRGLARLVVDDVRRGQVEDAGEEEERRRGWEKEEDITSHDGGRRDMSLIKQQR